MPKVNGPDFRNYRERRKFIMYLFIAAVVILLAVQCFRKETHEFIARWMEVSSRNQQNDRMDDLTPKGMLPGLDEKLFPLILENSPIFSAEVPAEAQFIQVLKDTPAETIREYCIGRVLFAQYSTQVQAYRGKVIRLKGVLRRVEKWPMPTEKFAVDTLYELWIQPSDCLTEPIIVYSLGLPEGFEVEIGADMEAAVAVDALFYKRYNYVSQQGVRCAPMFFAKAPEYVDPAVEDDPAARVQIPPALIVLVSLLLGGLCWLIIELRTKIPEPKEPLPEVFELPLPEVEDEAESTSAGDEAWDFLKPPSGKKDS